MAKSVYEQIKKQNGERFAKTILWYDNGIFEIPGIVDIVKYAGREAEPIMECLESLKGVQIEETGVYQDPITLLDKAGYNAYYVTNLEEQNRIQKYYASAEDLEKMGAHATSVHGERLCTFRDPHRFENYHIVNTVRKDVDKIKRENFVGQEQREDKYGRSVISIQILKSGGFISIKNRYNHTVENCDNTFGSNPDNIILGLSNALRHHFETDFSAQKTQLPNHYTFMNGQIIHYNYERYNIYFGSNFYVKDGKVQHLKDHEIMLDTYIFDIKNRTISDPTTSMVLKVPEAQNSFLEQVYRFSYGTDLPKIPSNQLNIRKISDGVVEVDETTLSIIIAETECKMLRSKFPCVLLNELKGHKVRVTKDKAGHHLMADDTLILSVRDGAITELNLPTTTKIDDFLPHNTTLETFNAPNLTDMGEWCFEWNKSIKTLNLPALKTMGKYCFSENRIMESINLPVLTTMGAFSFTYANIKSLDFPKLETMGEHCFF